MNILLKSSILSAALGIPLMFAGSSLADDQIASADDDRHPASHFKSSPLVDKVRAATRRYKDVNVALADDWVQGTPCVSGPNEGAMGVHFVRPDRIGDGELNANEPEALIYEPLSDGRLRLVGVEFIVLADDWDTQNPDAPPALEGHLLNLVAAPNRYRLPAFYELHVWAWERNPNGAFADWNKLVSCNQQPSS
jgi:hypothetical protein